MTKKLLSPFMALLAAATLAAIAAPAGAQFGAVVPPPARPTVADTSSPQAADSAAAAARMDLMAWVDSAAAEMDVATDTAPAPALVPSDRVRVDPVSADSAEADIVVEAPPPLGQPAADRQTTAISPPPFPEGAPAPDTGSALPLLAVLAAGLAAAGIRLRRAH